MDKRIKETLRHVAEFYDARKVGDRGPLGFRRSTDLTTLWNCTDRLLEEGLIRPGMTRFLDLGCADGRVNVFFSYLVKTSVGIEQDEWTLDEYGPLKRELERRLGALRHPLPPDNIRMFHGDATDERIHGRVQGETGTHFGAFDLFYTYLVMHDEFARIIARFGKPGAVFMVYGLHRILPVYAGFRLLEHVSPMEGILAVYRKEGHRGICKTRGRSSGCSYDPVDRAYRSGRG